MIWLLLQNFPIDTLSVRQFPLLMERYPLIELSLKAHRGRILGLRSAVRCFGHRDF
jgi:hypothetical protein